MRAVKLALLIVAIASPAWATAPTLNSVTITTTASNGSAFTFNCSGCGSANNNGKPDMFLPAYGGDMGNILSSLGRKTSFDNREGLSVVSTHTIPSGHGFAGTVNSVMLRDWTLCDLVDDYRGSFGVNNESDGAPVYMSLFKYDDDRTTNDKNQRYVLVSGGVGAENDLLISYSGSDGGELLYVENNGLESWSGRYASGGGHPEGSWFKEEIEFQAGTEHPAVESGDSYIKKLRSNVTLMNKSTLPIGDKEDLDQFLIETVRVSACPVSTAKTYFMDVKLWYGFTQVFISSAASNGTCEQITDGTRKSAQIVQTWGDSGGTGLMDLENVNTSNGICFSVRNSAGEMSAPVLATTNGGGPTSLSPSLGSASQTSLTATFTDIGGSNNYIGVLATDSGFTSIASTGTVTTPKTYNSLSCNTQYWFQVKVSTESDASYSGNQANATTSACSAAPASGAFKSKITGNLKMQGVQLK